MQAKIDAWKEFFKNFINKNLLIESVWDDQYFFTDLNNNYLEQINAALDVSVMFSDYESIQNLLKPYVSNLYKIEISKKVILDSLVKNSEFYSKIPLVYSTNKIGLEYIKESVNIISFVEKDYGKLDIVSILQELAKEKIITVSDPEILHITESFLVIKFTVDLLKKPKNIVENIVPKSKMESQIIYKNNQLSVNGKDIELGSLEKILMHIFFVKHKINQRVDFDEICFAFDNFDEYETDGYDPDSLYEIKSKTKKQILPTRTRLNDKIQQFTKKEMFKLEKKAGIIRTF